MPLRCTVGHPSSLQAEAPGGWRMHFISGPPQPPSTSHSLIQREFQSQRGVKLLCRQRVYRPFLKPLSCGRTSKSSSRPTSGMVVGDSERSASWNWKTLLLGGCRRTCCYSASCLISLWQKTFTWWCRCPFTRSIWQSIKALLEIPLFGYQRNRSMKYFGEIFLLVNLFLRHCA